MALATIPRAVFEALPADRRRVSGNSFFQQVFYVRGDALSDGPGASCTWIPVKLTDESVPAPAMSAGRATRIWALWQQARAEGVPVSAPDVAPGVVLYTEQVRHRFGEKTWYYAILDGRKVIDNDNPREGARRLLSYLSTHHIPLGNLTRAEAR